MKQIILSLFLVGTSITTVFATTDLSQSAHRMAAKFEMLNFSNVPSWTKNEYKERFRELRDKKFLEFEGQERRIPWLYVRDGCHMRATHFNEEAERLGYEKPKKIFIFGSLEMKGNIIPHGSVEPWFHIAPLVMVDGEPIVLDPSVSFSRPLSLKTWASRIVKDHDKVIFAICDTDAYLPTSKCINPKPLDRKRLNEETQLFLKFERNILSYIGLEFKSE
ncbi:MAG: hypothetical protein K9K67_14980 [Bacteriovoracaceae bacterium]|nr:hypothetical protein [Bacteriovoracaceae bacterium]